VKGLAGVVVCLAAWTTAASGAPGCTKEDFGKAVDEAGAALRRLNAENIPRVQAKLQLLKAAKGWPDDGFEERAARALRDERITGFDTQANELMARIDSLGTVDPAGELDCSKLEALTATSLELQATVKARTAYTLSKLDQMLGLPPSKPVVAAKPAPAPKPAPPAPAAAAAPPAPAAPSQQAQAPAKAPETSGWSATSTPGADIALAQPPGSAPLPEPGAATEEGYTIEEIMAASAGFFGKVSANLGSVIEHLFRKSGRPTGYVLGSEGGGAFLAGVRYGSGTLYLRAGSTQKIYWHGPSLGTDLGADGSKTLFLLYRLRSPEQLYANFTGVDGSAYLVGGVGATLMSNGDVIIAPIRSGLGLRIGANVGYVRFTPKATWNPF
jgi:hypothetical protein